MLRHPNIFVNRVRHNFKSRREEGATRATISGLSDPTHRAGGSSRQNKCLRYYATFGPTVFTPLTPSGFEAISLAMSQFPSICINMNISQIRFSENQPDTSARQKSLAGLIENLSSNDIDLSSYCERCGRRRSI